LNFSLSLMGALTFGFGIIFVNSWHNMCYKVENNESWKA
jgi:hypothetical protein